MSYKKIIIFFVFTFCFTISASILFATAIPPTQDVNISKLALGIEAQKQLAHCKKKTESSNKLAQKILQKAGWAPNPQGIFNLKITNQYLLFRTSEQLCCFYILVPSRPVLPARKAAPVRVNEYLVVEEQLTRANHAKLSNFGYIGRGKHIAGARFGVLPFNADFIRLLFRGTVTAYVFTLTDDVDLPNLKDNKESLELHLKCQFSPKTNEYLRIQDNIKNATVSSTSSHEIKEYLLCVDIIGAFLSSNKNGDIIREWSIAP